VQVQFLKVLDNSTPITKVHGNVVRVSELELDLFELNVKVRDVITVQGRNVYVVSEISSTSVARCVSPNHPVNDPTELSLEQANHYLLQNLK
jgi:hypothetical protein